MELSGRTVTVEQAIQVGLEHQQAGRLPEAEATYREVLESDPDHPGALYLLGLIALNTGRSSLAVDLIEHALAIEPDFADAHFNLGIAYQMQGKLDKAVSCFNMAVQIKPDYVAAHFALGLMLQQLGRLADATVSYRQALAFKPDYAEAHCNLGVVLQALGKLDEAAASYRRAIGLKPDFAAAHCNLGNVLQDRGQLEDALDCYRQALALQPELAEAHCALANVYQKQDRAEEALASYRRALEIRPDYARALANMGNALQEQFRFAEAVASYRRALAIKADMAEAHLGLGHALKEQGEQNAAAASYRLALECRPAYVEARWALAFTPLPSVHSADDEPRDFRAAFSRQLEELDNYFGPTLIDEGYKAVGGQQPFYLAYQEDDNRELLSRYGALCHRLMLHWQQAHGYHPRRPVAPSRIRIGIVSKHFQDHSVWNALVKGWVQHLDREMFELHLFSLGARHDAETAFAKSLATTFVAGAHSLSYWVEAIIGREVGILVYPEIGMDEMTVKLASLRLAPVQVATWGHPETTGLPTIDYYISADGLEPASAEKHYSERLVRMPHLGCCYHPIPVTPAAPDLAGMGIDEGVPLLLAPGVPYKYAPRHDPVLVEIARRLGQCQLVFFTFDRRRELSHKFQVRLERAFAQAGLDFRDYGVFVPWMDRPSFHGLMRRADVFLDTIGFSGFNTAMQAVECGLPIVAYEGRFMRGRLASGILHRIGLSELVATRTEDYISLVVKLAHDRKYRQRIVKRMAESQNLLFDDLDPIRALEDFFLGAAVRPQRGNMVV